MKVVKAKTLKKGDCYKVDDRIYKVELVTKFMILSICQNFEQGRIRDNDIFDVTSILKDVNKLTETEFKLLTL